MFLREVGAQQPLQRLLWRSAGRDPCRCGDGLGAGAVRRLGEHRLARSEVGVEAAVREASLLHDVGDAGAVVATSPDGACGGLDDTFVRDFLGFGGGSFHMIIIISNSAQEMQGAFPANVASPCGGSALHQRR